MRPIMNLFMAFLVMLFVIACSRETPPAQEGKSESPAVVEPAKELAKESVQKAEEPASEVEKGTETGMEALKKGAETAADEITATASKAVATVKEEAASMMAGMHGPGTVVYNATMGKVTFDHAAHSGRLACAKCHTTDPPKVIAIDKKVAHTLCTDCHRTSGEKAPTTCTGCHVK